MKDTATPKRQTSDIHLPANKSVQGEPAAKPKAQTMSYTAKDAMRRGAKISRLRRPFYEELDGMQPFFDIKVREGTRIVAKHVDLTPGDVQRLLGSIGQAIVTKGMAALKQTTKPSVAGQIPNGEPENSIRQASVAQPLEEDDLPNDLLRLFVRRGNEFYYRSQPGKLAFVDSGKALKTNESSVAVVNAFVAIAIHRRWTSIEVAGSEDFKALVWAEATGQRLQVTGYSPSSAQLASSMAFPRSTLPSENPTPQRQRPSAREAERRRPTSDISNPPPPAEEPSFVLLEFGPARYKFDPDESSSFYVKLSCPDNTEQILWGVQLREALDAAGAHSGDVVSVTKIAVEPTQVPTKVRDGKGRTTPGPWSPAKRNKWEVKVLQKGPESLRLAHENATAAQAFRQNAPAEQTLEKFPQLASAYVASKAVSDALAMAGHPPGSNKVAMAAKELLANQIALGNSVPRPHTSGGSGKQEKRRARQQPRP